MYSIYFFIQILIFRLLNNKLYFNLLYAVTNLCLACYILLQTGFYKEIESPANKANFLYEQWFINTNIYWFIDILLILFNKIFYNQKIRKDQIIHHLIHIIGFKYFVIESRMYHVGINILYFAELSEPFSILSKITKRKLYFYMCSLLSIIRTIYFTFYLKNAIFLKWKFLSNYNNTVMPYVGSISSFLYLILLYKYCKTHIKRAILAQ